MSETLALTMGLFLIGGLHTLIFGTFQYPSNFIVEASKFKHLLMSCKVVLYGSAIGASLIYQTIARFFGIKNSLIIGLLLNLFGILFLWINRAIGGNAALLFIDMCCFGLALSSVINVLITFIIVIFPKKAGAAITALFIVLNGGIMLSPLLIGVFKEFGIDEAVFPFLMICTVGAIWHAEKHLFEPPYPKHLHHLRKGTLIWKELHYRLVLYFLALVAYAVVESSYALWGFDDIVTKLGEEIALETVPIFYLFMIIGQLLVLIPLYLYAPEKIFYGLTMLAGAMLYFVFQQTTTFGFILMLAIGGLGCSAIFPILISFLERELVQITKGKEILPYIETGVSVLIAGYFLGNAGNDLWIHAQIEKGHTHHFYVLVGIIAAAVAGLIGFWLNTTAPKIKKGPSR